jgi:hypothetical protein
MQGRFGGQLWWNESEASSIVQRSESLHGVASLIPFLFVASLVLFVWGLIVLFTGGYVATLDIAANLISAAALVFGLAVLARLGERALAQLSGGAAAAPRPGFFNRVSVRAAPEPAAPAEPADPVAAPESDPAQTVIREGVVEGRHFRLYADGSIDAEGPAGMRRYASVEELRADMLAAAGESTPAEPEPSEAAPEEAREPTARSPFAPRPTPEPSSAPDRLGGSAETGLGGVRSSERLTPSRGTPERSSWSDRFRSTSLFDKDEAGEAGAESEGSETPRR